MEKDYNLLADMPVSKVFFRLAIPAVASMSILNSIMQFVMLLLPGLVQGAQPLLSYNLGAGDVARVKKTFRLLLLCCVSGSFFIWLVCMTVPATVALIFILPQVLPDSVMGVYLAEPIADTIAICTTAPMFYFYYKKL